MAQTIDTIAGAPRYTIRLSEPADMSGIVDLYDHTFGGGSEEWFEWKYVENPATEHVPIVVATHDGEVVGARPCVPFRMRVGEHTVGAIRFGDTMVDPNHRRRGLFSRTTRRMIEYYSALEPAFGFNHPNQLSLPGYRTLGGRVVDRFSVAYRIQNPAALLDGRTEDRAAHAHGARLATPFVRAYLEGRDRLAPDDVPGITVTRQDSPPAETLATLYETDPPTGIHAERTAEFYEWRFRNPKWEYVTYVASRDEPIAAVVAGTGRIDGAAVTTLTEVVPMASNERREAALSALIGRVLEDHRDADLLAYAGESIPESLLRSAGFHRDTNPPLSWLANETRLLVHNLSDEQRPDWRVEGTNLLDPSNWSLSFCEQDAR